MKTLMVNYLPRGEQSSTKALVDAFEQAVAGKTTLEKLDLCRDVPDMFLAESVQAYIRRNYMGQPLDTAGARAMAQMDRMTAQLRTADVVVVAFPMHNFGLPAVVKAWFDSVLLKGQTWDISEKGYVGLLTGRKALILNSSGGVYEGPMAGWEHAVSLAKVEFQFMGFGEIEAVVAAGLNQYPERRQAILDQACARVREVAARWCR